jgi:hypothetical protein
MYVRKFRWDRDLGKGFLIYEEMSKYLTMHRRRPLIIYDFATDPF